MFIKAILKQVDTFKQQARIEE